jgi:cystathionine beta-synthase
MPLRVTTDVPVQKGSILALPETLNTEDAGLSYIVEGIGYDFVPEVLSRVAGDIDEWVKTSDVQSFEAARLLMRMEGLLCGGSSGAALGGLFEWVSQSETGRKLAQTPGANVVCAASPI